MPVASPDPVDTQILAVGLQRQGVVDELAAELGVGKIGAVVLPVLKAGGAVDLEQRRSGALGHLGLELLLVGVGGGGHDLDLDAPSPSCTPWRSPSTPCRLGLEL